MLLPLLLGGIALLVLVVSRPKPVAPPAPALGGGTPPAPGDKLATSQSGPDATGIVASVGAVVTAAVTVAAVGAEVDKLINPNSNEFSQAVAIATFGTAAAVVVAASTGLLTTILVAIGVTAIAAWPLAGIILGVAALAYAAVVVIQDLVRLQFGQAGAREEYAEQFSSLYVQLRDSALVNDASLNELALEQKIKPFVRGHMARLNWSAYQDWLLNRMRGTKLLVSGDMRNIVGAVSNGIYVPGSWPMGIPQVKLKVPFPGTETPANVDTLWDINFALDRGYIIGEADGMREVARTQKWNALNGLGAAAALRARERILLAKNRDWAFIKYADASQEQQAAYIATLGYNPFSNFVGGGVFRRTLSPTEMQARWDAIYASPIYLNPGVPFADTGGVGPEEAQAREIYLEGLSPEQVDIALGAGPNVVISSNIDTQGYFLAGWVFANFVLYKSAADELKGDVVKLRELLAKKKFEGEISDEGALTYLGITRHYTELQT